jgi:nucleoside-diphosphate-sugar epimerase
MTGTRVLVTGASGFIGRHVVPLLAGRGHEVHAVARRKMDFDACVTGHAVDLLDPAAARALIGRARPAALLHLAWIVTPGAFWTAPENLDWVAASLALIRAFAAAGGTRAVIAGTCAEYDWSEPLLDEATTPLRPRTLYGAAKCALHALLAAAAPGLGLSLAWGRVFFLYGPGEAKGRLVPDVIDALRDGRPALCGPGTQRRDFMHVADVARAFVALLESDVAGPVNIASGTCRPLGDLILRIGEILGRPDLIRLGARPMPPDDPPELRAATRILNERIGFTPRQTLELGLASLCAGTDRTVVARPDSMGR